MTKTTVIATDKEHLEKLIKEAIQAEGFKCNLNHVDVSQVTDMEGLFEHSKFNGDISAWNTSNVLNMMCMFQGALFQGDLSKWNVAKVKDMWGMFEGSNFNKDISSWDVSNVLDMDYMFRASRFKGDLSKWSFHSDVAIKHFFDAGQMDQFEIPNLHHWQLLLNGFVTQNIKWREHVAAYAPILRSLANTEKETAMLIHRAWLSQELGCKVALAVPFESLEIS